jgi:SAM-dependent methyltransferase
MSPPPDRRLGAGDINLAFRLILGRPVDESGLKSYQAESERGMGLESLIAALLASDEYRNRPTHTGTPAPSSPDRDDSLIRPADVIRQHTIEELIATSEEYYRRVDDPTPLMSKPFTFWHEAPQMLHDLGLLFSGMHIGKTMTVLDFGAGTCWLSRILAQLNCQPISCDVSATALEIGRQLFERLPTIGTAVYTPRFLLFDGHRIDLPDESVDRIVCFDAFHHIPNPDVVLREFGRVLRRGGVLGMSEPGRHHSRSPQSQYEMRNHKVLENDIDLGQIFRSAKDAGFTALTVKALADAEVSLDDYHAMFDTGAAAHEVVKENVWRRVVDTTSTRSIFFLHKGPLLLDSRGHVGLAHEITAVTKVASVAPGERFTLTFDIRNTGTARWLHQNTEIFGIVRLASHLMRANGDLIDLDFSRHDLPASVDPGEGVRMSVDIQLQQPGDYNLVFDLVAEGVTWFENAGSKPVTIPVAVRPA